MLDLIATFLVRQMNVFFHAMPVGFNISLGRSFGRIAYFLSGKRGRVTYANLKAAFCGEKTPRQIRRMTKGVYRHMGQTFAELLFMTKIDKRYIDKYVHIENFERVLEAAKNPKGMILVSAHFGNWEISTVTGVMKGFPLYLLARDQKMKRLNELLNLLRETKGNIVVRKGWDVKSIFRILRSGKSIGILADQNAGAAGKLIDFFGRPASVATGPYRFAQRTGAWILPAFIHRTEGPYHELVVEEPMILKEQDDIVPYMVRYNQLLEKHVREFPEQWFWMHKRWKATPLKKVMVLDDGKRGHLKQSLAAVNQIKRFRAEEGKSEEYLKVAIVKIQYKNRFAKVFLAAISSFITYHCGWHLKCLKLALAPESYENAVNRYADVIVSCGSSLYGVNRILKLENSARNLAILDPGALNRGKFDLVVIPRHDITRGAAGRENIVVTDLALSEIGTATILNNGDTPVVSLRSEPTSGVSPPNKENSRCPYFTIGLLVGGNNRFFTFGKALVNSLTSAVRTACEQEERRLYATTSRRTPDDAEEIIKAAFENASFCDMFVSGKTDTDERTVEKILAMSDIIIVSGESISMVSEAVSSGRPVLVFMPEKKTARFTKYERFVKELGVKGFIRLVKTEDIPHEVDLAIRGKRRTTLPGDNKRLRDKLYKLF